MTTTNIEHARSSVKRVLTALVPVALIVGLAACGGDDATASEDETQFLVEELLDAARNGASSDQLADLLAEADPEVIAQVVPQIEGELDISLPDLAAPPPGESDDATTPQGDASAEGNGTDVGSTSEIPSTSTAPVVTIPGGVSPTLPTLPPANIPTTKAPVVTLPGGVLPSLPSLPAPKLPSTSAPANRTISFDLVQLDDRSDSKFLQVIVSVDAVGKPGFVELNYETTSGVLTRRLSLTFEQQMDPNTSLWTTSIRSDADPCSLRFTIVNDPSLLVNTKGITLYKNFMGC